MQCKLITLSCHSSHRTKQNQKCRSFVNKASCEFCVYHIQREYQKTSSKRSDIQSSFTRVDPKRRLQEKVLGKDQVSLKRVIFYTLLGHELCNLPLMPTKYSYGSLCMEAHCFVCPVRRNVTNVDYGRYFMVVSCILLLHQQPQLLSRPEPIRVRTWLPLTP